MELFSVRNGYTTISKYIQRESADEILRTELWNLIFTSFFDYNHRTTFEELLKDIWSNCLHKRLDAYETKGAYQFISKMFLSDQWYVMFDLLEAIPIYQSNQLSGDKRSLDFFRKNANKILEKNLSVYRFVDELIIEITSEEEIDSIEKSLNIVDVIYSEPKTHLKKALQLLSNRKKPDYKYSISESLNAIKELAFKITGNPEATLLDAIKEIETKKQIQLSLKTGFEKLYGYKLDNKGIKHKLLPSEPKQEDALYVLVASSALINYLIAKNMNG